jgi:energy-coupling factor transporter ATP-binding protein EcfA2
MRIKLERMVIQTKKKREIIDFSELITFIYGPVGKGKSTLARLIDFCLGGDIENTPAIQQEFVSATLHLCLNNYNCVLERGATENTVRMSWFETEKNSGSINAPLQAKDEPIISDSEIYSLSDMIFFLCGIKPIKVRQSNRDIDSPLIRLSFRDLWHYCYLEQMHMDSSFFRFEDPFRRKKSQDAMRFFTGLHSERMSQLETNLMRSIDEQRAKRVAVKQIREFMNQFSLGSENGIDKQLSETEDQLNIEKTRKAELHRKRNIDIHPTDLLRERIKLLGEHIYQVKIAIDDSTKMMDEQRMLHSELITAKIKNERLERANILFEDVVFENCPACGEKIQTKDDLECCRLCGRKTREHGARTQIDNESLRKDINIRIDELADSIKRRGMENLKSERHLARLLTDKARLDTQLHEDLSNYDSAIIEEIRYVDKIIATLEERITSLIKLQSMPQAINKLEEDAGALQGTIDRLKTELENERKRLSDADITVKSIADEFKRLMTSVKFPGVYDDDKVVIDSRYWRPEVMHGEYTWGFEDTGSCGKKTLFNVCYALAIHSIAKKRNLPVPSVLIIDSPTKNISKDENPELVKSLYKEIYQFAIENYKNLQFILIDSDYVSPTIELPDFKPIHMAGTEEAPSLISYYDGP